MKGIRIYVEGGGSTSDGKTLIRKGFQEFFGSLAALAREKQIEWDVIPCGSREKTFDSFRTALAQHPDNFNVLVVDSEAPVTSAPWDHLSASDKWSDPGSGDECCHLMVQTVEAWFIADPDALAVYYGQGFRRNALPGSTNVEAIAKGDLMAALKHATSKTAKGPYTKIRHCSALLARVSVDNVRKRAQHCDRLFTVVERRVREWTT